MRAIRWLASASVLVLIVAASGDFVTVQQDSNGVWWFMHRAKRFYSMGINHVNNGGQDDGVDGREAPECKRRTGAALCGDSLSFGAAVNYSQYYNSTMERWGSEEKWANVTVDRLRQWNFNTIGGWSAKIVESQATRHGLYYVRLLDLGTTWLNHNGLDHDPWSKDFDDQVDLVAKKAVAPRANDEMLIGWQLDNELRWEHLGLAAFLKLPRTPTGSRAMTFVRERYASITQVNAAWQIEASSFEELPAHLQEAAASLTDSWYLDNAAWTGLVADRYFNVTTSAVKRYDKNHLILGLRGANLGGAPSHLNNHTIVIYDDVIRACAAHVDVFDWHGYQDLPGAKPYFNGYPQQLQHIYSLTKKPVFVGEFSFMAWDSNLPNSIGARNCPNVDRGLFRPPEDCKDAVFHKGGWIPTTQKQRADHFETYVRRLAELPFAVGHHWWQWADQPAGGRWPDGENSNYGLVHIDDDPYSQLTDRMREVHRELEVVHASSAIATPALI